ncbi:hypothetical protein ACF09G_32770 [Streptomyces albogriseolus]|uniref:hypothetical protein n=1 Tax=Streptomyces albogriseolus TaxID=1887 RepID=UPI0036FBE7D2
MSYRFAIDRHEAGSVVTDTLHLRTPPGLLRFAASQAGAVQWVRARVLTDRLARPVRRPSRGQPGGEGRTQGRL